jgi:hypothetical protein
MPQGFSEYAALWREQIDPEELAELQSVATKIKRTAGWRWLVDYVLALIAAGMVCMAIWRYPGPALFELFLALLLPPAFWHVWKRHQITRASRAIAVDDPRRFFEAAIENVRAEINLSTLSAWMGLPVFVVVCALTVATRGFDHMYMAVRDIFTLASVKTTVFTAVVILVLLLLLRDNLRLRAQLRRLEAMRREWEERDPAEAP